MINNNYKLYIYGSRGTHSVFGDEYKEFGGQTNCYIIKNNTHAIVIDCGSGLFNAKELLKECNRIDVLITHLHYDHIWGLLGNSIFPEKAEINFYGKFDKWSKGNVFDDFLRPPFWPTNTIVGNIKSIVEEGKIIDLKDGLKFCPYPSNHGKDSSVFVIYVNDEKVCILSDYGDLQNTDISIIKDAKYMLYDGTYEYEESLKYIDWGHSSWNKGCELAKAGNVKNLIITHHNPNNNDNKLKKMEMECQKEFPNSRFARVYDEYEI